MVSYRPKLNRVLRCVLNLPEMLLTGFDLLFDSWGRMTIKRVVAARSGPIKNIAIHYDCQGFMSFDELNKRLLSNRSLSRPVVRVGGDEDHSIFNRMLRDPLVVWNKGWELSTVIALSLYAYPELLF